MTPDLNLLFRLPPAHNISGSGYYLSYGDTMQSYPVYLIG